MQFGLVNFFSYPSFHPITGYDKQYHLIKLVWFKGSKCNKSPYKLRKQMYYHLNSFVGALTRKLPEVHVLPEPEILVYQSLEVREQVTG